ncbi:MAG: efflux RND transporter periplasmic adaptor subunit [Candidatus Binataceae bacterium]
MAANPSDQRLLAGGRGPAWHAAAWLGAMLVVLATSGAIVMARTHSISVQRSQLATEMKSGPRVLVARAGTAPSERQLNLPATIEGYAETPIYAKIAGYLKEIRVDKGDRVRKGQVVAILESPELDQQVADARHNLWLQSITDARNQGLVLKHGISQQTADNSHGMMLQAADSYRQLLAEQSYEVITAPFNAMVTARYVDPGTLIPQTTSPGRSYVLSHASETATPMVMLATLSPLRVYASAPQDVANLVHDGAPASISVEQRPGHAFAAHVTRHAEALDPATRMMLVEVDLPNSDGTLYPGMYGTMTLTVKAPTAAPLVSDDALIFRNGKVFVPVVRNSVVHLAAVSLGYDNGYAVETTSGISAADLIALNLGQSATEGERVIAQQETQ